MDDNVIICAEDSSNDVFELSLNNQSSVSFDLVSAVYVYFDGSHPCADCFMVSHVCFLIVGGSRQYYTSQR